MAAGGSPPPPGAAPQVPAAMGQRPAPRPAPRRRRRRLAAPAFLLHQAPDDDVLFLLPAVGPGAPRRPPRAAPRPKRRRRRQEEEEADEGRAVGPPSAWGSRLPPELLLRIFQAAVEQEGAVPFLCRAARVCRLWRRVAAEPRLWRRVSLGGRRGARAPHNQGRALGALRCLAESRFSLLQEFALCGWRSHVGAVLQVLGERCPLLSSLTLRGCQVEPGAIAGLLAAAGPRLRQLRLGCGPRVAAVLGALAGGRCPGLRVLELDPALGGCGPPLPLPIERLQAACPHLQVLRLLNLSWAPRQSPAAAPGPGFPRLQELSLAGPGTAGGTGVGDQALRRLLHASARLRLLDLRGCTRVTPRALLELPCADLEQLYLGLPCGAEQLPRLAEGSAALAWKWRRSLRELDLAGRGFGERDLAQALAAFGPGSPLRSLNLAGTKVTAGALSALLPACPLLAYLNLSSCRHLPRGTKRPHRGCPEVRRCLRLLGRPPPGEEPPNEEPPGEEPPSEEPPNMEPPNEEPPGKEPPNEEPPGKEPPNEEPPNMEPPNEDPPNEEPPNMEPPNEEPPSEELPNEQLNKEPPQ